MKKTYEEANLDIIVFNSYKSADIIFTSGEDESDPYSIDNLDDIS